MSSYWVFFEAVNYDLTVYDQDALPATRGASYALLRAPQLFAAKLNPVEQVEFSSSVLCKVEADKTSIEKAFFDFLANPASGDADLDATLKSMSFSFGIAECSGDDGNFASEYVAARNESQRNRFRLQTARKRVDARNTLGALKNRAHYYQALGVDKPGGWPEFPEDFTTLLAGKPDWVPEKYRNKMVVLEFDADRLGANMPLDSFNRFKAASDKQHALMQAMLQEVFAASISETSTLELETLLYAGDEGVLVFPAWNLEKVIKVIARHLCGDGALTTYSVAMVICGVKTPILTLRRLTRELIAANKEVQRTAPQDPAHSLLQYVVVGDMDVIGGAVQEYREQILKLKPSAQREVFPIELARFPKALDLLRRVKTRGADGSPAAASHSRVKGAIEALRRYGSGIVGSQAPDARAAMQVIAALVVDDENPSPLVGKSASGGFHYFSALLHAAALAPFLPDAETPGDDATTEGNDG